VGIRGAVAGGAATRDSWRPTLDEFCAARLPKFAAPPPSSSPPAAALCAAPIALEAAGLLTGKRATAYPGNPLPSAHFLTDRVVIDDNIITRRGPGTALDFALTLVETLAGPAKRTEIARAMLVEE
jgi:putative intracellular protease/amidase